MVRKVFRTGNSLVVSIPRDLLEPLALQDGVEVSVELDAPNRQLVIRPVRNRTADGVDVDFARQVSDFIDRYRPALESLSKE